MRLGSHDYLTASKAARFANVTREDIRALARDGKIRKRPHPILAYAIYRRSDVAKHYGKRFIETNTTRSYPSMGRRFATERRFLPQEKTSALTSKKKNEPMPKRTRKPALALLASFFLIAGALQIFPLGLSDAEINFVRSPEDSDRVIVRFASPIQEVEAISRFHLEPAVEGDLVWLQEERELHFVPQNGFAAGTDYRVTVGVRSTLLANVGASTARFAFSAPAAATKSPAFDLALPQLGKAIDVNLSTMILTLLENGAAVDTYPVAGKGNPWLTPTREGRFTILSKEDRHWTTIYKVWMPYSMRYSGSFYLHGWPYWPNGRRLTSIYSGGCVRLTDDVAKTVYNWVDIGTPVVVHSTPGRTPLLTAASLDDGDLAREQDDARVYVLRMVDGKNFKRHVFSPNFASWYPHLQPFWKKVKTAAPSALNGFQRSRWVWTNAPSDASGNKFIYEIREPGVKHLMRCALEPGSLAVGPEFCVRSWEAHGWDLDELFTVSQDELSSYQNGEPLLLPSKWEIAP